MEHGAMTFDEVSMEHGKSFILALQELKNLRPQLYSAADYCEKSYKKPMQGYFTKDSKFYKTSGVFHLLDSEGSTRMKTSAAQPHLTNGVPTSGAATQTMGATVRDHIDPVNLSISQFHNQDALKGSKPLTTYGSFDDRNGREAVQVHTHSKSVLASFSVKQTAVKLKAGSVL